MVSKLRIIWKQTVGSGGGGCRGDPGGPFGALGGGAAGMDPFGADAVADEIEKLKLEMASHIFEQLQQQEQ